MADETIVIRGRRFIVDECGSCGVFFVIPELVYTNHRDHGGYSYCSNGHTWGWKEGRIQTDAMRRERDRLKQDNARLEDEKAAALREAVSAKAQTMQVRRRAAAGVCPCCNRTFQNVQRHMKTKHPNVVPLDQKQTA